MDNFLSRHKNLFALVIVLAGQIVGLAMQVKVASTTQGGISLMRLWSISAITPIEKFFIHGQHGVSFGWSNYFYLRGVRRENRELRAQIEQMRLQQVRLEQDALQARRLQSLFKFKEEFISDTLPAQVIGSSGSDQSRIIYIDKGADDGIKVDQAVIAPDGIVGKVLRALPTSSQVLLINDQLSGVGATLEKTRLQGILAGTPNGALIVKYVMKDEKVEPGENVVTSGGDRIFPKGLPIGKVVESSGGKDMFLNIRIIPAANLSKLEEVLVVTKVVERQRTEDETNGPVKASDILAERLPSVPPKAEDPNAKPGAATQPAAAGATTLGASTQKAPAKAPVASGQNPPSSSGKPPVTAVAPANSPKTTSAPAPANPAKTEEPQR